jgi:transposase
MSEKKYLVELSPEEREHLESLVRQGKAAALVLTRARILLKADQGASGPAWDDARIAEALDVGLRTISRVRQRLVERGFTAVLERRPQEKPSTERKLDGAAEARLIAMACSKAPDGRVEWTMQLLADKLVELKIVDAISDETVRRTLKKTLFNRGGRSSGAFRGSRAASSSRGWKT